MPRGGGKAQSSPTITVYKVQKKKFYYTFFVFVGGGGVFRDLDIYKIIWIEKLNENNTSTL